MLQGVAYPHCIYLSDSWISASIALKSFDSGSSSSSSSESKYDLKIEVEFSLK